MRHAAVVAPPLSFSKPEELLMRSAKALSCVPMFWAWRFPPSSVPPVAAAVEFNTTPAVATAGIGVGPATAESVPRTVRTASSS